MPQPHYFPITLRTRALTCTIHTSIQYEYTTKDEYECNTSVEKSIRYWILYIMQCKLLLERRQRFMRRAIEYSSVKSVSSLWFSRAPTSQLIIPPAMRADCTERLRRKSAGTCMYMYPYVWMYIPSRIPIRIAKAMRERQKRTWGWASAVWRGCARVWARRPDRCAASSPARPLCLSSLNDVAV